VVSFKILEEHSVSLFRSCYVLCVCLIHYSAEILVPALGWGEQVVHTKFGGRNFKKMDIWNMKKEVG